MRNSGLRVTRIFIVLIFALAFCAGAAQKLNSDLARAAADNTFRMAIPLGLPADTWDYYIPRNNPLTAAKIELGRKLFFEARLSADGSTSCATCHDPKLAFTDGKALAEGIAGRRGTRNSPTLLNALFNTGQFWDGRADTLEDQAPLPLINPLEMGEQTHDQVIARLRAIPEYREPFQSVFGGEATIKKLAQAIAAYERTLVSGDAPFDRFFAGESSAMSEEAKRGFALFRGKARCSRCHTFSEQLPFFTDFSYHNTGVATNHPDFKALARKVFNLSQRPQAESAIDALAQQPGGNELGRVLVTYQPFDIGSYKTPSLRNVALTAPYFHDGSAKTLADVVRFYNDGGKDNINREWDLTSLSLSESEQRDLIAFLQSLTGKSPQ